jgi:hypothetical protein
VFSAIPGAARAESAGELGRHFGIRYTMPIIVGPLRELRQGMAPLIMDPVIPGGENAGEGEADAAIGEMYSTFNPDLDFDEPLYSDYAVDGLSGLYAVLHKRGSRVSYEIFPLMKFPVQDVKQRTKQQAKKQARETRRSYKESKQKQQIRK